MTAPWSRINTVLLLLVLLALLSLIAMFATGVRGGPLDPPAGAPASTDSVRLPGTPIAGQYTISTPGHYYVTRDIKVSGAQIAITINASEVSLDLGGFILDGTDVAGSKGILISAAQTDISIKNGTLKDFQFGLDATNGSRVHIDNVRAVSNVRGFQLGLQNVLSECMATENTETGIYAPILSSYPRIQNCVVELNDADGITLVGARGVIEDSIVQLNDLVDIRIQDGGDQATIRDNTVDSIRLELDVSLVYILDNVCVGGSIVDASGAPTSNFHPTGGTHPHDNAGCG